MNYIPIILLLLNIWSTISLSTQVPVDHHNVCSSTRQPWRQIQEQAKDCVVQLIVQRGEMDICKPWAPPLQQHSRGSAFFIDEKGYLLTNAHVVDQALAVWLQIPSLGKRPIDVDIVGVCYERDVALIRIADRHIDFVQEQLGSIPHLSLGDSDMIYRTDEVLALGYPLGQESLKSTTGVLSGREQQWIQMDAAINPGSSGGPLLNVDGQVIGINSAGYTEAQNVGYIIPINNVKVMLAHLYKERLLFKPVLGVLTINVTDDTTDYLGNPQPGGCFVAEVIPNSPSDKAGLQTGDMIYEINGHRLDIYGEMNVPWSEDKISIMDYISRIALGQKVDLVVYRQGERLDLNVQLGQAKRLPVRRVYPGHEPIDYEIFGGMVVMELTLNHIKELSNYAPCLVRYGEMRNQNEPVLVVTHIFANSQLHRARSISPGATLVEVNEQPVRTLEDFRQAIRKPVDNRYFVVRAADKISNITDNLFAVLPLQQVLNEEIRLSHLYHYPISDAVRQLASTEENRLMTQ